MAEVDKCRSHVRLCQCSSVLTCDHCRRWCQGVNAHINPKLKRDLLDAAMRRREAEYREAKRMYEARRNQV